MNVKCLYTNCGNNNNQKCIKDSILIGYTGGCLNYKSKGKKPLDDSSYTPGTRYGLLYRKNLK